PQGSLSIDWLDTPQARGWLGLPRENTPHNHGTGCTFASAMAAALALGWVVADAAVLAKMAATHALRHARAVGRGVGPVIARAGFGTDPSLLPRLTLGAEAPQSWATRERGEPPGVYAIVDSAERVRQCVAAGARTVQLRIKRPSLTPANDAAWRAHLAGEIRSALAAAESAGATLYINDHWQQALALGAKALHLGQEDLLALSPAEQAQLAQSRASGVALGLSSHSLWELCRAHALLPDYIACGPVWPTTTKDMPWVPQGLDNLAWWAHMAPAPVVAIGGILAPEQLGQAAACGAEGGCVVRGLGDDPTRTWPAWQQAWNQGRQRPASAVPELPHPTLPGRAG
ncbi:MAG: thiamine phosphate synthase, partial [Hydrogenophaga sp.]